MNIKDIFKEIKIISILLVLFMLFPVKTQGAELSDVSVAGIDVLTDEQFLQAENAIEKIPDSVIQLFNKKGGKLIFQRKSIILDNSSDEVLGAYWPSTHKIVVRTMPQIYEGTQSSIKKTIFHEYGHFVYQNSVDKLSSKSRKVLENTYRYYREYNPLCSDPNETFACVYSWYYEDMAEISPDMKMVIKEAEDLCKDN